MADFDCAIIGSGTAGGVLAHFLTEGGLKCLLLEAGQEYHAGTYPDSELEGTSELYWNGGMDISQDGRLVLLRAKCVGGGSIINQCLLDRFDQPAFSTMNSHERRCRSIGRLGSRISAAQLRILTGTSHRIPALA